MATTATPGDLVRATAEAIGIPHATIVVYDRYLAAAGLRSKGGRGWSAPRVTARDAASLLTAILASGQVKDAVDIVRRYDRTRAEDTYSGIAVTEIQSLPPGHSFIDALEAIFTAGAAGAFGSLDKAPAREERDGPSALLSISAMAPGTLGEVRIAGMGDGRSRQVRYLLPDPWSGKGARKPSARAIKAWERMQHQQGAVTDFEQYRRVSERTILRIAALLGDRKE